MLLTKRSDWLAGTAAMIVGGLVVVLLCGCGGQDGPERAGVSGTVTAGSQPVEQGSITFMPSGQTTGPSAGGTIKNGSYSIDREHGPVVGSHRVQIRAMRKTGKQVPAGPPAPPEAMVDEVEQFIPPKYNSQSTLTAEVQSGSNTLDFKLQIEP